MTDFDFTGKKALVRVDFNVPIGAEGQVGDDNRIRAAIPTIEHILAHGGSAILMSHLGRPKGKHVPEMSLAPVAKHLQSVLSKEVIFATDCVGEDAKAKAAALLPGQVLLLENLRFHDEEEAGDVAFAEKLSTLGDVYINDAFGTAHRAHASTTIIADFFPNAKFFGKLMQAEVDSLELVMNNHQKPFVAIIGGSKVSDKVGIIQNLINIADTILIGGAMAYTLLKAKGGEVGMSRIEADKLDLAAQLLQEAEAAGVQILLPEDSKVTTQFSNDTPASFQESAAIDADKMGLDIGPKAIADFTQVIHNAKTILWNGPMGVFEWSNYEQGTKEVAQAVADATQKHGAYSLIGGGDSVAAIFQFNLDSQVSYVSTGGGAMLEYLEGKMLPGIAAIKGQVIA